VKTLKIGCQYFARGFEKLYKALAPIVCLIISLVSTFLFADPAAAQTIEQRMSCSNFTPGNNFDGSAMRFPAGVTHDGAPVGGLIIVDSTVARPGLVFKIVTCIEDIFENAMGDTISALNSELQSFVALLIVLYISIFGVKLALVGVTNIRAEVMTVLLRTLIVFMLVISIGVEDYILVWKTAQLTIANAMMTSIDSGTLCNAGNIWLDMDCVMANILGANDGSEASKDGSTGYVLDNVLLTFGGSNTSPLTLLKAFGGLWSSDQGFFYGLLIIMIVILLFFAVAQIALVYVVSLFALIFAGLIAPLMVPMLLFDKTKGYFDKWLRLLFAYFLPPVLMVGYLAFMVNVMNYVLLRECRDLVGTPPVLGTPYDCGLVHSLKDFREGSGNGAEDHVLTQTTVFIKSVLDSEGTEGLSAICDPDKKAHETQCQGNYHTYYLWDEDEVRNMEAQSAFLRELIMITLLLMMILSFLQNVLVNAGKMVGTPGENVTKENVYARSMRARDNAYSKAKKEIGSVLGRGGR
jgi:hypothetical protein